MITQILREFIKVWMGYNGEQQTVEEAVCRINSGDCGLSAIAVHYVLLHKFQIETQIIINRNHCWLKLNGVDYDTKMLAGYSSTANEVWSNGALEDTFVLSFKEACDEWMPCDTYGAYLVKAFVEKYGLPFPPELQHCIDNQNEYEGEQGMPSILKRYENAKNI